LIPHQMQPLIEAQLAKRGHSTARWVNFGASSAPHVVSVVLSLLTKNYINTREYLPICVPLSPPTFPPKT
jgi:hypothetical protein